MNDMRNPYIAGAPVVETSMFFGRGDVFKWIENSLTGKYVDHILVLHGQRRVGKTTVLKQIPNFLPEEYIQVFFDLQGRTNTSIDRFLWWMASEIIRTLNKALDINLPRVSRDQFSDPDTFITDFIPNLRSVLGDQTLLLTFDEFDTLAREDIQEQLARPLINFFRRLFDVDGLNFIFSIGSSGNKLENMQAAYTNFFKSALYRKVSFLTTDDCIDLITKPVADVITYHPKAVQRIIEMTSGHPYFTQLTCHELFSQCQSTGSRQISVEDVENIIDDVIERGTVNLKFVWDEATDLEKWILAALGMDEGLNQKKIAQVLRSQGVRFSDVDLNTAVLHLRDKDVLTKDNHLVIHLMKLWLELNRPMDRVREELVQANPIADRYIEIGDEYRDRGQQDQALSSYQQALSAQANNLDALFNMGSIYLDQGNYQLAASSFEKALQVDSEHIASRQGFCQAYLAIGDQAGKTGSKTEAIEAYQSILNITPVHAQARRSLADIYREQAEAYLSSGADQQALEQLQLAMEMTPEDEELKARYQQILDQKKAALVKSWMDKAERAIRRQRWDEAASMADEALKVDPDDIALQARVAKIKDAPRQEKLKIYRGDAEAAIVKGDYAKAIEAIKTAILLAPDDAELKEWLEATQDSQQDAQLRLYQSQAKKAQDEGNWEAAVTARQAALKLDPENDTLLKALEETQAAQHQAKLDALHAQVASARQAERWDEAIQAAGKLLTLTPDDAHIKQILDDLQSARRQARLDHLLKEADTAAGQELWGDAVKAWEAYLDEVPSEREKYEAQLEKARQYARLSADYEDAQTLIKKGQYNKAIPLLQGIVAQDPTYKSTSRLLVEAVEARGERKPIWAKPWLYGAFAVVVIVVLGFVFSDQIMGWINTSQQETPISTGTTPEANSSSPPGIVATTEESAFAPVVTETPIEITESQDLLANLTPESAMSKVIEPINEYVNSESPSLEDDFSVYNAIWGDLEVGAEVSVSFKQDLISGGTLSLQTNNRTLIPFSTTTPMTAKNFVLEFNLSQELPTGSVISDHNCIGVQFRSNNTNDLNEGSYYEFCQLPNRKWAVNKNNSTYSIASGAIWKDEFILRLIAFDNVFAIYADDELLTVFLDEEFTGENNYILAEDAYIFVDDLKFWNLDQVNEDDLFGTATEESQTETMGDEESDQISQLYNAAKAYMAETTPTTEDDFKTKNYDWGPIKIFPVGIGTDSYFYNHLQNGQLQLSADLGRVECSGHNQFIDFNANNFILRYSLSPQAGMNDFIIALRGTQYIGIQDPYVIDISGSPSSPVIYIHLNTTKGIIQAKAPFDPTKMSEMVIVAENNVVAVFVDGSLIVYDTAAVANSQFNVPIYKVTRIGTNSDMIYFDDISFWNLDSVDFELLDNVTQETQTEPTTTPTSQGTSEFEPYMTSFVNPILDYIADRPPDVEDDFSTESDASVRNSWEDNQYEIVDNELRLLEEGLQNQEIYFFDYVLEVDIRPISDYSGFWALNHREAHESGLGIIFNISKDGNWEISIGAFTQYGFEGLVNEQPPYHLQVILKGSQMAFLINGELVAYNEDEPWRLYRGTVPTVGLRSNGGDAYFDNFKVWNITRFDLPSD